jgi:hypothetical protein
MGVSGQLHTLTTLAPGKQPALAIAWKAGWAPETLWTLQRREKSIFHLLPQWNQILNSCKQSLYQMSYVQNV